MTTKKTMVLNSLDGSNKRAVLSFEDDGVLVQGKLRLYGFDEEPSGIICLGLVSDGKVTKAGLTKQSYMLFAFSCEGINLDRDFSCAVINFVGAQSSPLLYGASSGEAQPDVLDEVIDRLKGSQSAQEVEEVLDDYGIDYDDNLKQQVEQDIDDALKAEQACISPCANCVYKRKFYQLGQEETAPPQQPVLPPQEKPFYEEIKQQVDSLFQGASSEEFLEQTFPSSKWIKVELDGGSDYYVFGLIYQQEQLQYVCYGVPGLYSTTPPKQLSGYPVWLPLDKNKKEGFGYWLCYQDAGSGESVKVTIE